MMRGSLVLQIQAQRPPIVHVLVVVVVNIDFSNQIINTIDFDDNEDGILMFELTEDYVDEETINEDEVLRSEDTGNTAQLENDLNKEADDEDGV